MNSLITSRGKVGLVEIMVNVVLFHVSVLTPSLRKKMSAGIFFSLNSLSTPSATWEWVEAMWGRVVVRGVTWENSSGVAGQLDNTTLQEKALVASWPHQSSHQGGCYLLSNISKDWRPDFLRFFCSSVLFFFLIFRSFRLYCFEILKLCVEFLIVW